MLAKNTYLWTLIALLTLSNIALQTFGNLTASLQIVGWSSWIILTFLLFMFTEAFAELKVFAKDAYNELKKVVWPTKQETVQTTLIVIVMVGLTGFALWLLDNFMIWLIAKLARIG
jgi:preprotein translocase subunit SecE